MVKELLKIAKRNSTITKQRFESAWLLRCSTRRSKYSNRHKTVSGLCSLFALLLIIPFLFENAAYSEIADLKKLFETELQSVQSKYQFPGATAAYILPDGRTGVVAVGLADVERQLPMQPESRMLAASIGKTFVGATALSLAGEGAIALDSPVANYLGKHPWYSRLPNHEKITVRHLLTHTSGIANHVESEVFLQDFRNGKFANSDPPVPESLISYVLDQPPLFEPGDGWYYTDTGYILTGLIIESVAVESLYKEITDRFLEPLQLNGTSPSNHPEISGLVPGYVDSSNVFGLPQKTMLANGALAWNPALEWAGGGFVSNSKDLVIWGKKLFEGDAMDGNYLPTLLQSVPVSREISGVEYGIAAGIHHNGPFGASYGHGGWIPGYVSSLRYYPRYKIAVAFQLNTDIGIVDNSNDPVAELEERLTRVVIDALSNPSSGK
ncbi:MAG: serine hydrolase [Candidatus Marinimicrobia bacterium]|nr:serine hydrolase [Candidatus Neomarinimicrobiota bacterium]